MIINRLSNSTERKGTVFNRENSCLTSLYGGFIKKSAFRYKKQTMIRNQVAELSKLSRGDCFYKVGDKKRKTFAFIQNGAVDGTFIICPSEFYNNRFQNQNTEKLKEDIKVVFLRQIK